MGGENKWDFIVQHVSMKENLVLILVETMETGVLILLV